MVKEIEVEPWLDYLRQRLIIFDWTTGKLSDILKKEPSKPEITYQFCVDLRKNLETVLEKNEIPEKWLSDIFDTEYPIQKAHFDFYKDYLKPVYRTTKGEIFAITRQLDAILYRSRLSALGPNELRREVTKLYNELVEKQNETKSKIGFELM